MKIVLDAGHGLLTPGKQTPDGEKEWVFNNAVLLAVQAKLFTVKTVQLLRVDDSTGKTDDPLKQRTDRANAWNADLYLSFHHNAHTGVWGDWGGVETFTFDSDKANPQSVELARRIQPRIVQAMQLRDRGVKKKNLHVLRETRMPSVLIEGGFMDSRTDIRALRNPLLLKAQGEAIADAVVDYYHLQKKSSTTSPLHTGSTFRLLTGTFPTKEHAEKAAKQLRNLTGWTVYIKE
ncbi:N-acetylmuramoyl-L-alanine amidase family protein [Sporosarcina sp. A2]|uniref:N-acetylmuramoyl-L-alanine amidase family protein n=1 Tax=Sporosarcina sp. A2 TaxID=3393449 RepID=UPI003D7B91EB